MKSFFSTSIFILFFSLNSFAVDWSYKTAGIPSFRNDPGTVPNHTFGDYRTVKGVYFDPNFEEGLALSSPLKKSQFQSAEVVVVINIENSTDEATGAPIQGQTVRVYAKESLVNRVGSYRFENTNYDSATGLVFYWKVSTARPGKSTPRGVYRPQLFSSNHRSSIYDDAFMPWSVFFNGSIATHGTFGVGIKTLGQPASAGCVRIENQRAKDLFHLIGLANGAYIVVQ